MHLCGGVVCFNFISSGGTCGQKASLDTTSYAHGQTMIGSTGNVVLNALWAASGIVFQFTNWSLAPNLNLEDETGIRFHCAN